MNNIIHTIRHTARAATMLLLALLTAQTARAKEGDLTDFVTVSSQGTATAWFAFSDHFYRVDWSGINTSQTTSVLLYYNQYGYLRAHRNGSKARAIETARAPALIYGFSCKGAREAAVFFIPQRDK